MLNLICMYKYTVYGYVYAGIERLMLLCIRTYIREHDDDNGKRHDTAIGLVAGTPPIDWLIILIFF